MSSKRFEKFIERPDGWMTKYAKQITIKKINMELNIIIETLIKVRTKKNYMLSTQIY